MQRRNFMKGAAAAAVLAYTPLNFTGATANVPIIKPKALQPGDTVGIIAPATAVTDPDDLAKMNEVLDFFNLRMKIGKNVLHGSGYKTRSVKERIDDLHEAFADPSIKAVMCIRGGYGSMRILDKIDYDLIRRNPKIFIGYSDITVMHEAIRKYSGLITFHGPMMLADFNKFTSDHFKAALFSTEPIGIVKNPETKSNFRAVHPCRTIVPGKATGILTGGNLSMISATMGTPYEIDAKGKILFLEDVGEEPYRIDRMLTQLRLSGKLNEASGIVIGECSGCDFDKLKSSRDWDYSFGEVIDSILGDLKIPVFTGLTAGHTGDQLTLPLGIKVELDADQYQLNFTESALS